MSWQCRVAFGNSCCNAFPDVDLAPVLGSSGSLLRSLHQENEVSKRDALPYKKTSSYYKGMFICFY